jgi:D-tyrosyl-tRNA(Tyr) deacylase
MLFTMRVVLQRVAEARVDVDGRTVGQIGPGLFALVGVEVGDTSADAEYIAEKIAHLRLFDDEDGKMNLSLTDIKGAALVVSQFTLLGDARKGRRPSWSAAARPDEGQRLYEAVVAALQTRTIPTQTGVFGADMRVHLVNDGPVTLLLDSRN